MKGILFLLIGPSGAGKNTLINHIIENSQNLFFLPSYTSREKRTGEYDGNPYYFITRSSFEKKITDKEFLEYQLVNGNYYGTSKNDIIKNLREGKNVITDIEVLGAIEAKLIFPNNICTVFITALNETIQIERIKKRHKESKESLAKRIERSRIENSISYLFDYSLCNDKLESSLNELDSIIKSQKNKIELHYKAISLSKLKFVSYLIFKIQSEKKMYALPPTIACEYESEKDTFVRHIKLLYLAKNEPVPEKISEFEIEPITTKITKVDYPISFYKKEKQFLITSTEYFNIVEKLFK